jgi:hypothetical protein
MIRLSLPGDCLWYFLFALFKSAYIEARENGVMLLLIVLTDRTNGSLDQYMLKSFTGKTNIFFSISAHDIIMFIFLDLYVLLVMPFLGRVYLFYVRL